MVVAMARGTERFHGLCWKGIYGCISAREIDGVYDIICCQEG